MENETYIPQQRNLQDENNNILKSRDSAMGFKLLSKSNTPNIENYLSNIASNSKSKAKLKLKEKMESFNLPKIGITEKEEKDFIQIQNIAGSKINFDFKVSFF